MRIAAALGAAVLATGIAAANPAFVSSPRGTVALRTDKEVITITPYTAGVIKVGKLPAGSAETFPESPAVAVTPDVSYRVISMPGGVLVETDSLIAYVDSRGALMFYTPDGELLLEEKEVVNKPDERRIVFGKPGDEFFYGAGERGHALTLNGDTLTMYNRQNYGYGAGDPRLSQMGISVPYFVSDLGYGVLFDDYSRGQLVLGKEIEYTSASPAPVAYYVINGSGTLAGATDAFTELTGRQSLPPFWALGYITSKYGYRTQAETMGVIDTLKTRGYPVDGIVLDLYWYGQETDMGRLEWNRNQWPDHVKMLSDLKAKGVNLVAISQPYINKKGALDNYNFLKDKGMLTKDAQGDNHDVQIWVGESGMFDVSNPDTRAWLWNRYKTLTAEGIEGWWGDLGEPEVHPGTIVHHNGLKAEDYHNLYGNEWSRIIYEGLRRDFPEKRPLLMMRGGTTGLQRYSVFPWTTDVARSWEGLQPQVNLMLNSGLSGLGYMSSDIGGFAVDPARPTNPELYVRWLQMGAFTPMLRTHAQQKPEPYNYPQYESISRRFIRMRYEWLPYNYTLAWENATTGAPLARPLNFRGENPEARYAHITDEYLWGDNVLIAPVMKAGARQRSVVFPAGRWIDWNNPRLTYKGGTTATVKAPLRQLPMFVRAGSFIPQYLDPIENTGQYDPSVMTIKYFPSDEQTEYTLFEDDRTSTESLADGTYKLMTFAGKRTAGEIAIDMESTGFYKDCPEARMLTLEIVGTSRPASVQLGNETPLTSFASVKAIRQYGYHYDAATRTLTVRFLWNYEPLSLTVR